MDGLEIQRINKPSTSIHNLDNKSHNELVEFLTDNVYDIFRKFLKFILAVVQHPNIFFKIMPRKCM